MSQMDNCVICEASLNSKVICEICGHEHIYFGAPTDSYNELIKTKKNIFNSRNAKLIDLNQEIERINNSHKMALEEADKRCQNELEKVKQQVTEKENSIISLNKTLAEINESHRLKLEEISETMAELERTKKVLENAITTSGKDGGIMDRPPSHDRPTIKDITIDVKNGNVSLFFDRSLNLLPAPIELNIKYGIHNSFIPLLSDIIVVLAPDHDPMQIHSNGLKFKCDILKSIIIKDCSYFINPRPADYIYQRIVYKYKI